MNHWLYWEQLAVSLTAAWLAFAQRTMARSEADWVELVR